MGQNNKIIHKERKTMDRRIQKTRKAIFDAFTVMLSRKSYDKITVHDLIEEANIGRSTFYAHFETKDDLLKSMCIDLFEHIFATDLKSEKSHDFSDSQRNAKIMLIHIFYHLLDEAPRLKKIFACESSDLFWQYFRHPFEKLVTDYLLPMTNENAFKLPKELLINHIAASFIEIVRWWFHTDLTDSPETVENYFEITVFPLLKA
jgi:AcrR family transcriptional regulator